MTLRDIVQTEALLGVAPLSPLGSPRYLIYGVDIMSPALSCFNASRNAPPTPSLPPRHKPHCTVHSPQSHLAWPFLGATCRMPHLIFSTKEENIPKRIRSVHCKDGALIRQVRHR
ncbi:hypothetical protein E2C01_069784 [Portunus trituberculatus]|uniref:Uncharacterized protein n=1 Tax=Portunus trituberculatus TaxID=210409 RepID=A0A5B7I0C4_PORTR|nr:hypothetical protein [Portunus trituberculatus]